jgi:hypothetical protein
MVTISRALRLICTPLKALLCRWQNIDCVNSEFDRRWLLGCGDCKGEAT